MSKVPRLRRGQAQNMWDIWLQFQRTVAEIHAQATRMRERIVSGTDAGAPQPIDASALLDGLWDKRNAFPEWRRQLTQFDAVLRSAKFQVYVREQRMDTTINLGVGLDVLLPAMDAVVVWVGDFFGVAAGAEPAGTVEYVDGERRSKQWPANDPALRPLVPLLDAVIAAIE